MKRSAIVKLLIGTILILSCSRGFSDSAADSSSIPSWIVGSWKLIGFIYHNEFKPPLNPNLELFFIYRDDGTDTLYWSRIGESGFCERQGRFSITGNYINDENIWTNPKNNIDCGQDPDMQVGRKTCTAISYVEGSLRLNLGLAGEDFFYVFRK